MSKPCVLVIDDHADDEQAKIESWTSVFDLRIRHPDDVTSDDLKLANVVVVDYMLDAPWSDRDNQSSIALKPMNGLALAAVLKSHEQRIEGSPTAFVLRSAHLGNLSPAFPPDSRLHVIARQNNLEWVLDKSAEIDHQLRQIRSLADAMNDLPENWPTNNPETTANLVQSWLKLPVERWQQLAWQDIEDCHPPLHELGKAKDGLRLVRWLGQRILPYQCFLWSEARLAVRLRVTRDSLHEALGNGLAELLRVARYVGALDDFDGEPRWWRSGLESILWDVTEGRSFDTILTIETLNQRCNSKLHADSLRQPVLCVDRYFRFRPEPCELEKAVRVQSDDWPVFAEQAWADIADARAEPHLAVAVIATDRLRLTNPTDAEDRDG